MAAAPIRIIWKFPFTTQTVKQEITAHGTKVVAVGLDANRQPCLWIEGDPDAKEITMTIYVLGTGEHFPPEATDHLGSFTQGLFVWHVYRGKA